MRDATAPTDGSKIALNAGSLRVTGDLQRADFRAFQRSLENLCASPQRSVCVDLTRCSNLSSRFIGELAGGVMRMKECGKDVHVEVSPQVGKFLQMARMYNLFDYEIA